MGGAVRKGRDEAIDLPSAPLADGDLEGWLPPVTVADLTGQIAGALASVGQQELAADLLQVVLEDRDAAGVAVAPKMIDDHGGPVGLRPVGDHDVDPGAPPPPLGGQKPGPGPGIRGV